MLWKLWDNYSETEFQKKMLKEAIEDKVYLQILETKEWKLPIHSYTLKVTSATKKKIDILKKMVMHTILNIPVENVEDLSSLLHVEILFISDIVNQMLVTGSIEKKAEGFLLTPIGKEQYDAGTILSEPAIESFNIDYILWPEEVFARGPKNELIKKDWDIEVYRYLQGVKSLQGQKLSETEVRKVVNKSGQGFEVGGDEKIVSKIEPLQMTELTYAKCYEFQLYDLLENKTYARVWNGALSRWDEKIEEKLNHEESDMWKKNYEDAIFNHFPERYDDLKYQLKVFNSKSKKKNNQTPKILRGKDIRSKFLKAFTDTNKKMLMVSPWISSAVIDIEMIRRLEQFAKQNKTLYISWGIAKNLENESRKPNVELLNKLKSIKHDDGTQAIFVRWFGNQHNKEIVVDSSTHLLGSYNWLSYRGDYDLRHESVVVMKDEKIIKDTTDYIELKFIKALERELPALNEKESFKDYHRIKNWMKELLLLSSSEEKRIALSHKLIISLREHEEFELVHELAILWVRYDAEEFGVRGYLKELLDQNNKEKAKQYYHLCMKHLQTFHMWKNLHEFKEHKKWLDEISKKKNTNS